MKKIERSSTFKQDLKRMAKRNANPQKLIEVIELLAANQPLPAKYKDHALQGNYKHYRECHVEPDWLLIYQLDFAPSDDEHDGTVFLTRTGTHSDLF